MQDHVIYRLACRGMRPGAANRRSIVFRRRPLCDYILPKRRGGSRRSMLSLRRCTVSSYAAIDNSQTTPTPSLPCTKPAKPPSRPLVSISKAEQAFVCMLYHHHHHDCICGTQYTPSPTSFHHVATLPSKTTIAGFPSALRPSTETCT
jgi:hypothetical protein